MTSSATSSRRLVRARSLAALIGASAAITMCLLGAVLATTGGPSPSAGQAAGPPGMSTGSTSTASNAARSSAAVASPTVLATFFGNLEP